MLKLTTRLIAVLLAGCLVADPATASAVAGWHAFGPSPVVKDSRMLAPFQQAAMVSPAVPYTWANPAKAAKIRRWFPNQRRLMSFWTKRLRPLLHLPDNPIFAPAAALLTLVAASFAFVAKAAAQTPQAVGKVAASIVKNAAETAKAAPYNEMVNPDAGTGLWHVLRAEKVPFTQVNRDMVEAYNQIKGTGAIRTIHGQVQQLVFGKELALPTPVDLPTPQALPIPHYKLTPPDVDVPSSISLNFDGLFNTVSTYAVELVLAGVFLVLAAAVAWMIYRSVKSRSEPTATQTTLTPLQRAARAAQMPQTSVGRNETAPQRDPIVSTPASAPAPARRGWFRGAILGLLMRINFAYQRYVKGIPVTEPMEDSTHQETLDLPARPAIPTTIDVAAPPAVETAQAPEPTVRAAVAAPPIETITTVTTSASQPKVRQKDRKSERNYARYQERRQNREQQPAPAPTATPSTQSQVQVVAAPVEAPQNPAPTATAAVATIVADSVEEPVAPPQSLYLSAASGSIESVVVSLLGLPMVIPAVRSTLFFAPPQSDMPVVPHSQTPILSPAGALVRSTAQAPVLVDFHSAPIKLVRLLLQVRVNGHTSPYAVRPALPAPAAVPASQEDRQNREQQPAPAPTAAPSPATMEVTSPRIETVIPVAAAPIEPPSDAESTEAPRAEQRPLSSAQDGSNETLVSALLRLSANTVREAESPRAAVTAPAVSEPELQAPAPQPEARNKRSRTLSRDQRTSDSEDYDGFDASLQTHPKRWDPLESTCRHASLSIL